MVYGMDAGCEQENLDACTPAGEVIEDGDDPELLVRELLLATYRHDSAERQRCVSRLDSIGWTHAALLLAAAKEVTLARFELEMHKRGIDRWIANSVTEIARRHDGWMRIRRGAYAALLRSGLGERQIVMSLPESERGRMDVTIVEYLLALPLKPYDMFTSEVDATLSQAHRLAGRWAFKNAFGIEPDNPIR